MKQSLRSNQALRINTDDRQNRERDPRFGLGTVAVDGKKQETRRARALSKPEDSGKKNISVILPKISYEGVAKVGLVQANLLQTHYCARVEILSLVKEQKRFEELVKNLIVRYAVPVAILSRTSYYFFSRFVKIESDMILAHNIPSTVVASRMFKNKGIPYVAYIHDAAFDKIPGSLPSFAYGRIRESLKQSAIVFTNSQKTLRELGRRYDVEGSPLYPGCFTIKQPNGVKSDFFLFVHFISPRSSFKFLTKLLERESFDLIIAGGRRWRWREVLNSFKKFGERVRFVFEPTERDLSALYQQAKGLIFPEVENFGLSPLEAAACACPSVVADGSGVVEVLEKGREILTCKEGDINGFKEALQVLREDEKYSRQLGREAWKAAQKCSWQAHASVLAKSLETLGRD
jgi:glycosyltransferase involved in cell wall biosynthesis